MAEAAHAAETTEQLINIGIIIITQSTIFSSNIRKWHDKPIADRTWPNFKEHFKAAQRAIKKSQPATTTDSLGYHEQANAAETIVDQVIDRLSSQRDNATTITAETLAEQQMQQQLLGMANSTQQSQQMLDQMTALATTVSTLQAQLENKNQNRGRNNGGNRGRDRDNDRRARNGGRSGRGGARRPFQYCWSHGNCSHSGSDCESPSDGHIKDATYANMQGGSTNRCHWLPA